MRYFISDKIIKKPSMWLLLAASLFGGAADAVCYDGGSTFIGELNATKPLTISTLAMTAVRDKPEGAIIYSQRVQFAPYKFRQECTKLWTLNVQNAEYRSTPLPLATLSTGIFAGKVYQTSVPGIGVAIRYLQQGTLPQFIPWTYDLGLSTSPAPNASQIIRPGFELDLVKVGPITSGVLNAATLPSVRVYSRVADADGETLIPHLRLTFTGSIIVQSSTCQTPNLNVDMGSHQISSFTGMGSSPGWKDFSILLTNCPAFYGSTYASDSGQAIITGNPPSWGAGTSTTTPNSINFMISPNTAYSIGDKTFALDATSTAKGVKLQLGRGSGSVTPLALNVYTASGITPTQNVGANYSIPLKVRYIQTSTSVSAGTANASVQFTIQYL